MGDYHKSKTATSSRGTTLNILKDQLYSLNMRMLLAMQNHDEDAQEDIRRQMAEVQEEIDRMGLREHSSKASGGVLQKNRNFVKLPNS